MLEHAKIKGISQEMLEKYIREQQLHLFEMRT